MIDIIIPAYNAHKTLTKALASIVMQRFEDYKVTIVNDGGDSYNEIVALFAPLLTDIQEIGYDENRGPGYARQYGIEHTDGEYVMFVDADDNFASAYALGTMHYLIDEANNKPNIVISDFNEVINATEGIFSRKSDSVAWLFGKIFRRSFLSEHNIRFSESRANEDTGFNVAAMVTSAKLYGDESIQSTNAIVTYEWGDNPGSIVRQPDRPYYSRMSPPGFIYNRYWAFATVINAGVGIQDIAEDIFRAMCSTYLSYIALLGFEDRQEVVIENTLVCARMLYYDMYLPIRELVDDKRKAELLALTRAEIETQLGFFIETCTFEEFQRLLESGKRPNKSYKQIESEIMALPPMEEK